MVIWGSIFELEGAAQIPIKLKFWIHGLETSYFLCAKALLCAPKHYQKVLKLKIAVEFNLQ